MGIDVSEQAGWLHNRGLRVIGGGLRLHLDWPELTSFPPYGLVRPRADLDALLARQAVKAGARLHEQTTVTEPILDAAGRVVGVKGARAVEAAAGVPRADRAHLRGRQRQARAAPGRAPQRQPPARASPCAATTPAPRPTTTTSSRGWNCGTACPTSPTCCPATAGSSAWATARSTPASACSTPARVSRRPTTAACSRAWLDNTPEEWGLREQNATCPTRGAALPMGFNRTPHYLRGLLLVGDSRRLGQPVQRRGHPVRDGVRQVRGRGGRPGAGASGRAGARAGAAGLPAPDARGVGRVLPARRRSS